MLNIKVICVGKSKEKYWDAAYAEYLKRLRGYCNPEVIEVKEAKLPANASAADERNVIETEGREIMSKIAAGDYVVALDIQGKELLKTQEKFYLADTAFRYSVLGYNSDTVASSLENVVYLELCRRGYTVNVGKLGTGEIDFIATRQNEKIYVQVTQEINSDKTEKREYERLLEIRDNYPKYVLTANDFAGGNYEGIKTMHIADFLLNNDL